MGAACNEMLMILFSNNKFNSLHMKRNKRVKLEITFLTRDTQRLVDFFEKVNVNNYSMLEIVLGRSRKSEPKDSIGLLSTCKSFLLVAVLDKKQFLQFRNDLIDLLKEIEGDYILSKILETT